MTNHPYVASPLGPCSSCGKDSANSIHKVVELETRLYGGINRQRQRWHLIEDALGSKSLEHVRAKGLV